jgi:L-lactate dehydrogenase complex protein LldE
MPERPHIGLFVTCLVDLFRPSVGFAAVKLLEEAGCTVSVPAAQTCCGQPAYNSGDRADARVIARQVVEIFERFDYVVVPSGSCGGMLREHYPRLLAEDPAYGERAQTLAAKTYELCAFLAEVMNRRIEARYDGIATYHDACSGLRELGVKAQPRRLLAGVAGLTLTEMATPETCCGFGGTFCVKYPAISDKMVSDKAADIEASGADTLLAGDLGCLLNMAGKLSRRGRAIRVRHVAEILAGVTDTPPIGAPKGRR